MIGCKKKIMRRYHMAKLDIFPLLEQQGKTKYWLYKQLA